MKLETIDEILFEETKFSCYAGLSALLYNRALKALQITSQNVLNTGVASVYQIDPKIDGYKVGNLLQTRG